MKLRYLKRDQIYNENAKFELPEKDIFFMVYFCDVLMARDNGG
ncbi:hypothetical protein [Campylobacter concisus]|nr:hypothetical protein [Campylobacter concisus]